MLQQDPQSDLDAWLILSKTPKLGPVRIRHLLQSLGSPAEIINATHAALRALNTPDAAIRWLKQASSRDIEFELAWCQEPQHHVLSILDADYPVLLKELHDPPPLLFVKGDIKLLNLPQIAIVGSRNPSIDGKQAAFEFAQYLSTQKLLITSGLAQGIDAHSHKGALSVGNTIAVCATGLDKVYPATHYKLAQQITQQGALLSEFLPGTAVHKAFFPRRNRLISGLCLGTLIVEASVRSGSLITAQFAVEQGREVFAIPGSIHNPMAKGCHKLIQQGAKLVENAADIIEELQCHLQDLQHGLHSTTELNNKKRKLVPEELDTEYKLLLEVIAYNPISIDEIISNTKLNADNISSMLLILELEGWVKNLGSGHYQRA